MTDQSTGKEKQKKLQTLENKGLQRYMLVELVGLKTNPSLASTWATNSPLTVTGLSPELK